MSENAAHGPAHGHDQVVGPSGAATTPNYDPGFLTIWEWDGTTAQFDGADAYNTSPVSSVLTAPAAATWSKGALLKWVVTFDGAAVNPADLVAVRLVTVPLPAGTYRCRFEMEIAEIIPDAISGAGYLGVAALAEVDGGGDLYAYTWLTGTTEWAWRIDQGAQQGDAANTNAVGGLPITGVLDTAGNPLMGRFQVDLCADKQIGAVPTFQYYIQGNANAAVGTAANTLQNAGRQIAFEKYGAVPAAPAGWNPLTCLRFGIVCAQPASGVNVVNDISIANMRVIAI